MANSEENNKDPPISNQNYVSCIKIHGLKILPPILTEEKRKRMQYYRDLAIQVENKLKKRKSKRISVETTTDDENYNCNDSDISSISDTTIITSDKSSTDEPTFRSQLFSESCRTDVLKMLNDSQNKNTESQRNMHDIELPSLDKSAILKVPLNSNFESDNKQLLKQQSESNVKENEFETPVSLASSVSHAVKQTSLYNADVVLDVTQVDVDVSSQDTNLTVYYSPNLGAGDYDIHIINNNNNNNEVISSDNNKTFETQHSSPEITEIKTPPPLIRRNSYVLDSPSPFLLALMQQTPSNIENIPNKDKSSSGHKRRRWNLEKAKEKWSSIEHDLHNVAQKYSLKQNDNLNFNSLPTSAVTSPEMKMFSSSLDSSPSQNINKVISNSQLPEKESDIPTNDKPKNINNITDIIPKPENKTIENTNRFIKSYSTPLRTPEKQKKVFPASKSLSEQKPKKISESSVSNKKTDNTKRSLTPLYKQRKLSYDEIKRSTSKSENKNKFKSNSSLDSQSSDCKSKSAVMLPKKIDILSSEKSEQKVRDIIDKIHAEQSKQMTTLLAKQKQEQEDLMKLFAEQQAMLLSKLKTTYHKDLNDSVVNKIDPVIKNTSKFKAKSPELDIIKNSQNLLIECKILLNSETTNGTCTETRSSTFRSTYSSPTDTLENISFKSDQIEIESQSPCLKSETVALNQNLNQPNDQIFEEDRIISSSTQNAKIPAISSKNSSFSNDSLDLSVKSNSVELKQQNIQRNISSCSRQLFPTEKQIWASTKLCAFARGFLVRRLIKTDRVQDLIKTIRDTLLCAMELHHERVDNIQPADVELHRRLIQQVTAACYSFHDTFFELSKAEQMGIIATDRQRQKEKLLRPTSARSNTSLTSTTQKVLERKLKRRSSDSTSSNQDKNLTSRSYTPGEFRARTKSLGMQESEQSGSKKTSPHNEVMRRAMNYGANKKPWR